MDKAIILSTAIKLLDLTNTKTLSARDIQSAIYILYPKNHKNVIKHCTELVCDMDRGNLDMATINEFKNYKKQFKNTHPNQRISVRAVVYLYGVNEAQQDIPIAINITQHVICASISIMSHLRRTTFDIKHIIYALSILDIPKDTIFEMVTDDMIEFCDAQPYINSQMINKINALLINHE